MSRSAREIRSTTILLVRRGGRVALAGDGQVTLGDTVMKSSARKVRRLYNEKILAGFAGASADAFSLLARFEGKLEQFHGNLERAAVELSKEWRTDKILRHLEALLIVTDEKSSFLLSGNGDVIAPDGGVLAIGSGGPYALAAQAVAQGDGDGALGRVLSDDVLVQRRDDLPRGQLVEPRILFDLACKVNHH